MLQQARRIGFPVRPENVKLRHGDITDLRAFANDSIDVVLSTMALHHLPDVLALKRTYSEVARILKPDGGIYMMDFGHLKSSRSIDYFAHQYADRQPAYLLWII